MLWAFLILAALAVGLCTYGHFDMKRAQVADGKMDGAMLMLAGIACAVLAAIVGLIKLAMLAYAWLVA